MQNYPGFPDGVGGTELSDLLSAHAKRAGATVVPASIGAVDFSSRPFRLWPEGASASAAPLPVPVLARSVIIATGAAAKKLAVPGADEFWQRGISTCATCDGAAPRFRRATLLVVGGGDTACEEALHLARTAAHVILVHRRATLRASKVMADRVLATPNISVRWDSTVEGVVGEAGKVGMTGARVRHVGTGVEEVVPASGLFLAIGHTPTTAFLRGAVATDADGYIITTPGMATNVPGVYAAGDVQDRHYRQAITAAASGCVAALEAERWLALEGGGGGGVVGGCGSAAGGGASDAAPRL